MSKNDKKKGYKYTIYDRLRKMPVEDYEIAMTWLPQQLGITRATFRNWIYTKAIEQMELPSTAILKMSVFFECEPLHLFTYPFDPEAIKLNWEKEKESSRKDKEMRLNYYESI